MSLRVGLLTREYPRGVYGGAGVHVEHLAHALAYHVEVAVHCAGAPRTDPLVGRHAQPVGGASPVFRTVRRQVAGWSVCCAVCAGR